MLFCGTFCVDKPSSNPKCQEPIAAGTCFGRLISYGYDSRLGRCERFIYTGCMGNDNRFDSYEECERECGVAQVRGKILSIFRQINWAAFEICHGSCLIMIVRNKTFICGIRVRSWKPKCIKWTLLCYWLYFGSLRKSHLFHYDANDNHGRQTYGGQIHLLH